MAPAFLAEQRVARPRGTDDSEDRLLRRHVGGGGECGTLNYAVRSALVAVNVAQSEGAAAVVDPFAGEVFYTDGESARTRREGGEARLSPSSATRLVDVNLDPPFPNAPGFRAVDLLAHPRFVADFRPRVVSTSPALAWVAAGKRAAYVTDGTDLCGSVHFAAGIAVCRAAGARSPASTALRSARTARGSWPPRTPGRTDS